MSESRQYFMTIALSLEIESGHVQFIRQYDLMKQDESFLSVLLNAYAYGYAEVCAVTFAKPTK